MANGSLRQLVLADGTILADSDCGYADNKLHCWVRGLTFAEVFAIFSNPEKTKKIRYQFRTAVWTYDDFTELFLIQQTEDYVEARLSGGTFGGMTYEQNETE